MVEDVPRPPASPSPARRQGGLGARRIVTPKSAPEPVKKASAPKAKSSAAKPSLAAKSAPTKGASEADAEGDDDESATIAEPEGDDDVVEVVGEVEVEVDVDDVAPKGGDARGGASLARTDPLQAYLREIQRYPLLTREEEHRLTTAYVDLQKEEPEDDEAERQRKLAKARKIAAELVTRNLRLVVKLAYEYKRAHRNILDLVQEGNIGLMQAVKRYDPHRGVKLSSYAAYWIRAYMLRFILNNWRLVKLGTTQAQRKLFFNLNKEKAKLSAMGIDPSAELIAERLGVEAREVVDMDHRLASSEASLDAPVGDGDGRGTTRGDLLPAYGSGADSLLERRQMDAMVAERLVEFRKTLKGKDVIIFDRRMAADEPVTLQELGDEFGVSRERVRQLEARIAGKLRDYLRAELGDAVSKD